MNTKTGITLILASVIFSSLGLQAQWIKASGNTISEERSVSEFNSIQTNGSADIVIKQGDVQKLVVETDANLIKHIITDVNDKTLSISIKKSYRNIEIVKVYVTVPSLQSISNSGSGDIEFLNNFITPSLKVRISGSGDFQADLETKSMDYKLSGSGDGYFSGVSGDLQIAVSGSGDVQASNLRLNKGQIKINGSGDLKLSGSAEDVVFGVSGSGDIDAYDLDAVYVNVKIAGSGDVKIHAIESIQASIAGSGDVYYTGDPKKANVSSSGSGELIKR